MKNLKPALLFTRISIFYFLLPWVLMRFTMPEKASGIAAKYYMISDMPDLVGLLIAIGWAVLLVAFVIGFKKKISYGLVLFLHALGTAFTIPQLIIGTAGMKILFFAAIPVIGAMLLLYQLRDQDTLFTVDRVRRAKLR